MEINLSLHPGQMEVFSDGKRFKIVVAGRRWGKSRLAIAKAVSKALETNSNGYDLTDKGVFIIAPTHDQAKRIYWPLLRKALVPVTKRALEVTGRIELINDRWIELRGADKPETMRGVGLGYAILDEYADMKPIVWEEIIRPALADVGGGALFIGTPDGKNHFYSLLEEAYEDEDWGVWHFRSIDNPFIDPKEIEKARHNMTDQQFRQEFEASFSGGGSGMLKEEHLKFGDEPKDGYYVMTVDLAGFTDDSGQMGKYKRTDDHALCVTKIHKNGRHICDIRFGKWGARETAVNILKMGHDYRMKRIGIEKGALMNAIIPYLNDRMKAINYFPEIFGLWHGGKKKIDRIMWGLAPHAEHGRLTLQRNAPWNSKFIEQWCDFPNEKARDDLLDAAAYADQLADDYFEDLASIEDEGFDPLDYEAGI